MSNDKTDETQRTLVTGVAIGILAGAVIGLIFARRAHQQTTEEISETVEDLKERAQHVLSEISSNVAELIDKSRELFPDDAGAVIQPTQAAEQPAVG